MRKPHQREVRDTPAYREKAEPDAPPFQFLPVSRDYGLTTIWLDAVRPVEVVIVSVTTFGPDPVGYEWMRCGLVDVSGEEPSPKFHK